MTLTQTTDLAAALIGASASVEHSEQSFVVLRQETPSGDILYGFQQLTDFREEGDRRWEVFQTIVPGDRLQLLHDVYTNVREEAVRAAAELVRLAREAQTAATQVNARVNFNDAARARGSFVP
jgi:hypothetical protein